MNRENAYVLGTSGVLTSLVWGCVWGAIEATLGFALHLAGRFMPVPGMAGFVLFPVGLGIMLEARRTAGSDFAILATASIAAFVKVSSAILPGVGWLYVSNPSLAILAQGMVIFAFARMLGNWNTLASLGWGTTLALAWRLVFLAFVVLAPVQKGILQKGIPAIASFLLVDSFVNGMIIAAFRTPKVPSRLRDALSRPLIAPLAYLLVLVVTQLSVSIRI